MGRMKMILAVIGAVFVLLGVVATATMRSDSSPSRSETVVTQPATGSLATIPAQPTPQDVERIMAAITASMAPPAGTTGTTTPLTKEQVEAQLREQLKLLGITY